MTTKTQATEAPTDIEVIETRPADLADLSLSVDVVLDNPQADAAAMQQRFLRRQQLIKVCFQMTSPSQWVLFKDNKTGKATCYPQGGAADAIIRHILACTWQDKQVEVETDATGEPLRARASAWLTSATGRKIERFEGYREMGGFVKTKPDLIKGAFENLKSVALRDLLGLRGRQPEELQKLGLDLGKVGVAEFANNKAGASSVASFPWGNLKGKPLTDPEVKDKDLNWLIEKLDESIADQSKAKWRDANVKLKAAAFAEVDRRAAAKAGGPSNGGAKQEDHQPPVDYEHEGEVPEPGANG